MPHTMSNFWLHEEAKCKLSTLRHEALQQELRRLAYPSMGWRDAFARQLVRLALRLSPGIATPQGQV